MKKYSRKDILVDMLDIPDIRMVTPREVEDILVEVTRQLLEAAHLLECLGVGLKDSTGYKLTDAQVRKACVITDRWGSSL